MWTLWLKAKAYHRLPSELLGLTTGSYEAYCLDEAVWYLGSVISNELEQAGQTKSKGAGKTEAARKKVLAKHFGDGQKGQYADPALLFKE